MKKTDALIFWAITALSVALIAGCVAADASTGRGAQKAGSYQSPCKKTSTRKRLKVEAKSSAKPKQKKERKYARQKKKETPGKKIAVKAGKRDANTGSRTLENAGSVRFVCVPKCYVRQAPDARSRAVAELLQYDWVRVLKTRSSWCQVQTGSGSVGWLSQNLIK
jgi:hypothetical protein